MLTHEVVPALTGTYILYDLFIESLTNAWSSISLNNIVNTQYYTTKYNPT